MRSLLHRFYGYPWNVARLLLLPLLLFPIVMVFINLSTAERTSTWRVAVVAPPSADALALLLSTETGISIVPPPPTGSYESALKNRDLEAIVVVPENFDSLTQGLGKAQIQFMLHDANPNDLEKKLRAATERFAKPFEEKRLRKLNLTKAALQPISYTTDNPAKVSQKSLEQASVGIRVSLGFWAAFFSCLLLAPVAYAADYLHHRLPKKSDGLGLLFVLLVGFIGWALLNIGLVLAFEGVASSATREWIKTASNLLHFERYPLWSFLALSHCLLLGLLVWWLAKIRPRQNAVLNIAFIAGLLLLMLSGGLSATGFSVMTASIPLLQFFATTVALLSGLSFPIAGILLFPLPLLLLLLSTLRFIRKAQKTIDTAAVQ